MVQRIEVFRWKQSLDVRPDCFDVFHLCHLCRLAFFVNYRRHLLYSSPLLHSRELEGRLYLPPEPDRYWLTSFQEYVCHKVDKVSLQLCSFFC